MSTIEPTGLDVPGSLPDRGRWLRALPALIEDLSRRWHLTPGAPFVDPQAGCAWVAPAVRRDGTRVVLKLGLPHMESEHEIAGLRFWDGDPTVRLLDADEPREAMLLERCEPGTPLRSVPEPEQDVVIAGLLRRLWRIAPIGSPFRPLAAMTAFWADELEARSASWPDKGLVREGLSLLRELPGGASESVLLATDLHAGNVLRSQREPWLVIDPKPFVGDPAYDATQHLLNCRARLVEDPFETIGRFAGLLDLDPARIRLWLFARVAAEPRGSEWGAVARAIAPQ